CTTYMYATGFPPSSTHLGRGESWIPPKPGLVSGESIETTMPAFFKDNISKPLIERWHWDIYHYLCLGSKYLTNAIKLSVEETKMLKAAGLNQEERRMEDGRLLREGGLSQAEIASRLGVSHSAVSQSRRPRPCA